MKKIFSAILLMTAMVFSVSTFVSCDDLSNDLEEVKTQTTEMASTIKTLSDKATALESALATAQATADAAKADAAAAKAVGDQALAAAKAAEAAAATAKAEAIAEAKAQVEALQGAFEAKVKEVEAALAGKATQEDIDAAIAKYAADVDAALAVINTKIAAIETSLADKADKTYVDAEVAKLLAADAEINAEIKALKAYKEQIEALQLADEAIKADIEAQAATLDSLSNEITEIYKQLDSQLGMIASVSTTVSDLNDAVFGETGFYNEVFGDGPNSIKSQLGSIATSVNELQNALSSLEMKFIALGERLTSIVFIPDLYYGGIEATEYTYMSFDPINMGGNTDKEGFDEQNNAYVLSENKNWDYKYSTTPVYVNPVHEVSYFINPSHANLNNATFRFVSGDVETRASVAKPEVKSWEVVEVDGRNNLVVSMTALGEKINTDKASIFALEATVTEDGKDTIVTSDFARLAARNLQLVDLYNTVADDHIAETAPEALKAAPTLIVKYDGNIDIREYVETHYVYNGEECVKPYNVYEDDYMPENVYGLKWNFALVDYTIGGNKTSDSQFATLNGSVLTPCGTTDGKANGKTQASSIGKRPLVRVTVTDEAGKIVLVGFIKLEIVREASYVVADPTSWTTPFACGGADVRQTWSQFVDNILTATTDLSKEEFEAMYKLETEANAAVQYAYDKASKSYMVVSKNLGNVTEVPDVQATTTNVLNWTMSMAEQQYVYAQGGVTIYVRYIFESTEDNNATQYEGIFVPLTMNVTKPSTSVSKKIAEYWFNGQANAIINVARPTNGGSTIPWVTPIDQVWDGNAPKFAEIAKEYVSYQTINEEDHYKYYFAPEQPKLTVDGVEYQLYVASVEATDKTTDLPVEVEKNADLYAAELANALDVETGFYTNNVLYAKNAAGVEATIARLDQTTGVVTYNNDSNLAKKLLNAFASIERSEAKLYVNIGVANWTDCNVAVAIKNAVNPYYFLRPINYAANGKGQFVDGEANGSKVNVLDLFDFSDWRNVPFVTEDYKNIWLFAYYNIHSVVVDTENALTNMNQDDKTSFVKLSDVSKFIELTHESERANQNPMLNYSSAENSVSGSTKEKYETYVNLFGQICYKNNGSVVSGFQIKVPVKFIYDWGEINTYAVIPVVETMGN